MIIISSVGRSVAPLGLNKHFPPALFHAGSDVLGLDIDNFTVVHRIAQLQLLLGHLKKGDCTGKLIAIDPDYLEKVIGLGHFPLAVPHVVNMDHVPQTWITSISLFFHQQECTVEMRHDKVV